MEALRIPGQFALALVVLGLLGCGQSSSPAPAPTPAPAATAGGWPAFPGDTAPEPCSASAIWAFPTVVNGVDYVAQAGEHNYADELVPGSYVIIPGGGTAPVAYALYSIADLDTTRPMGLHLDVTAAPLTPGGADNLPLSYYVGISDFTRFTWHWFGPLTQSYANIVLNDPSVDFLDRLVSSDVAGNTCHIAIVTTASDEFVSLDNPEGLSAARIEQFTLYSSWVEYDAYSTTRPHFAAITTLGSPFGKGASELDPLTQYVGLTWEHLADPYGAELDADSYEIHRQGPADAPDIHIGSVDAPGNNYLDPVNNFAGVAQVIPGATYTYGLCAVNTAGATPLYQRQYTVPLLGPADVTASDGAYIAAVELSWTAAEGATGYKVYRDGQEESDVIATLGGVTVYTDSGLEDEAVHPYWVRSTNQYQPGGGEWSAPDDGSCAAVNNPPVAVLRITPESCEPGVHVELDGSGSYDNDPGDAIAKYEFDFGEGGGYQDYGALSLATHSYSTAGMYILKLRVLDMHGATDEDACVLNVYDGGDSEDCVTIPRNYSRGQNPPPYLQIFRRDPTVRRDSRMQLDIVNGIVTPVDIPAYTDKLKDATYGEFSIYLQPGDVGGHTVYFPYPVIVIEETDYLVDITGPDDPDAIPGVTIPLAGGREAARIAVDITALIEGLPPAEPGVTHRFHYKLYDATDTVAGWGMFDVPPDPVDPLLPVGVAWGVNVGARGWWDLIDFNGLATDTSIDGATITTSTPDMLWVRLNGPTRLLDWDEYWGDGDALVDNVRLVLEDEDGATASLGLRLVGQTGVLGDYFALTALDRNDGAGYYYDWVSNPPGGGILNPGHAYSVYLDDPSTAGLDYAFAQQLSVIGSNPNLP